MTYKIEGVIEFFDLSDLKIISDSYFKNFLKADSNNKAFYDTGFIHTRFKRIHTQIEEKTLLRGIIALITGAYPEFGFESFYIIDKNDNVVISGVPQRLCIPPRSGLDLMIHHEIDATRIYIKAFENLNLEWILVLFSQKMDDLPFIGWACLYSVYEIIGRDSQIITNKKMQIDKLIESELSIDKNKIENFKILANKSRNPFEGMRHGSKLTQEDQKRFDQLWHRNAIVWASDFIREIAIKWINYSYKISIMKPQRNNDAYGYTTNDEPLKLISPLEEYISIHYPGDAQIS